MSTTSEDRVKALAEENEKALQQNPALNNTIASEYSDPDLSLVDPEGMEVEEVDPNEVDAILTSNSLDSGKVVVYPGGGSKEAKRAASRAESKAEAKAS